ncbi:MAG TPA: ABC transporter ATP-binding protein [Deltaproteobacteria bacterium]|jgi:branched-chain amino acid transport system ATP-binding protein|nr:ABC transporter ATP-binding protein [Candidatus Lambdaproteobacteria bacterium]HIL15343.1 ABC transporter ATP-binding protein [Deltaproteobacteria bacterium]
MLQVRDLYKHFGGVVAIDHLDLEVTPGEVHALIGPNGAGKTTLIGQLTGLVSPDSGTIRFAGKDLTALPVHVRSGLGLARSFQVTSLFLDLTVLDNVALAVQAHAGHSFRFWKNARSESVLRDPARKVLAQVGLSELKDEIAGVLAHGQQRQLEIAMALATNPKLLLLDEPMAGMGPEESAAMVNLLRNLKGGVTMLLVEHDMDAVFALADRITVLVYGRAIATGTPDAIRQNPEVRAAYLGEDSAAV